MANDSKSDKLTARLVEILMKFNQGERVSVQSVMDEFQISRSTAQRDLRRLEACGATKQGKLYSMDPILLGHSPTKGMKQRFIQLGLVDLFPNFDQAYKATFNSNGQSPYLFKNVRVEDGTDYRRSFHELTLAIQKQQLCKITYKKQQYNPIQPYRLINDRGVWFLAALHQNTLKLFRMSKVSQALRTSQSFELNPKVKQQIEQLAIRNIHDEATTVVLKVDGDIANHFLDTELVPDQRVLKQLEDGSLIVSSEISSYKQIIPAIKYWLPDVEVVSPVELREQVRLELQLIVDKL
ncbi:helix-turn-helix transcriptional regulator [Litoribrevibacter albus]|uniref:WYL domain-containing protein n=1 Tax=Litoribrevibacter albus TaxID=1473156 RepID=A0AA37SFP9_9GAMM|nr:WYL domain-containing transcriptional regulator [Litoribrevibacter albus]GLQ33319.1 hypothetical protein GCM10007876_37990 [Litoribrevibacter albus]